MTIRAERSQENQEIAEWAESWIRWVPVPYQQYLTYQHIITINILLILQVRDNFFFMREKHLMGPFEGFFYEIVMFLSSLYQYVGHRYIKIPTHC